MGAYGFTPEILTQIFKPQTLMKASLGDDVNGGSKCAACTLVMAIISQTMQAKSLQPAEAYSTFCGYLPTSLAGICNLAADIVGPETYTLLSNGETPDAICNTLGACKDETAVCRLFPAKGGMSDAQHKAHMSSLKVRHPISEKLRSFNICTIIPGVCSVEDHLPFSDADGDKFSTDPLLRGSDWRGKDCNDQDATVYPGLQSSDATVDQNCNGIYGQDPQTGLNYEDEFCANSGAIGVATLGDSASAHFRIPQDIFMAGVMNSATFANIIEFIEDEADWPMLSWSTGHQNTSNYAPSVTGPMTSIYSQLNELNRCNHRDYQNLGVNGARSSVLVDWVNLYARNQATDKPVLAFFAMIGNDVCNGHHTFDTMTTPEDYFNNVYNAVLAADKKFPKGSQVILVPLVDARILYNTMHDRIHPIGALNQDVTYINFYDYLNCLEVSPCWGWMNSNETIRNTTAVIAASLNAQLPKVIAATKGLLNNVQPYYLGDLFTQILNNYPGPKSDLIEPVDGFHPSQIANSYIAQVSFAMLQQEGIVPTAANPNNDRIQQIFGDQGGY
eukprot:GDKK01033244.1.p1 GENE.GDKK01033244.1~~GDKK01033244.1.p1  ORF type:complete len:559 (-),score=100.88 GDKK01033244.1:258-1934(-)